MAALPAVKVRSDTMIAPSWPSPGFCWAGLRVVGLTKSNMAVSATAGSALTVYVAATTELLTISSLTAKALTVVVSLIVTGPL